MDRNSHDISSESGRREATALDLLEQSDDELLGLFDSIDGSRGASVEERSDYGSLAKLLVRQVATREAALVDVSEAIKDVDGLRGLSDRLQGDTHTRRSLIDELEHMSRGTQPMNLNAGQDFDGALSALVQELRPQIRWEQKEAIPAIRGTFESSNAGGHIHSAAYVSKHAPTNLHPDGSKWYERAPVVSRLMAMYDRLRDYPTQAKDPRK
jgi:hypothetical protein